MENQQVRERDKKRSLRRYRKNVACIERLEEKIENINQKISSPGSSNLSGMPRGGTPVTITDLIADKAELEERIAKLKEKGRKLKREILEEIDTLDDPRYCEVLEGYFINGYTLGEIAEKECYTERHVYRLYSEAITILASREEN